MCVEVAGVPALVYSAVDPAGKGIGKYLLEVLGGSIVREGADSKVMMLRGLNALLVEISEDIIYAENLDNIVPEASIYVFLSRHSAASGIKSLTTHHTGNPSGDAPFGGRPYELCIANPPLAYSFLRGLTEARVRHGLNDFRVTYEVTHHGPTGLSRPLTFIEIGSSESEWVLREAHEAVGEVVIEALKSLGSVRCVASVGVGGPHYAEGFSERALRLGECYGHIIPRYALKTLRGDEATLRRVVKAAILKSSIPTERVVVMKKVGAAVRRAVKEVAEELGVELIIA